MSRLRLDRPLAILDLETTGTSLVEDRVVEIAIVTLYPDGHRERWVTRVNPGRSIPAASSAIHGIRDEDVRESPRFEQIAPEVLRMLTDVDVGGYNALRFDLPLLQKEFERAGVAPREPLRHVVDPQVIFHRMEPRDLSAAVRLYCGHELVDAHGALADAEATLDVLLAQVEHYATSPRQIPDTVPGLADLSQRRDDNALDPDGKLIWIDDEAAIGFGKYKGTTLRRMLLDAPDYLDWIVRRDFNDEVKAIVRGVQRGEFPSR
ncbi:MAG: 3'-5' exonuclease [Pseudomonadota bacterium]